jgi:AcrR family transcriptional regulator
MPRSRALNRRPRESRADREGRILDATKELFDERGTQDAPLDAIARAVGIDKALIYRHFSSKEELYMLTITRYLSELADELALVDREAEPVEQLRDCAHRYATYCLRHPAFLDSSLSLMRRPAQELAASVTYAVWLRLGRRMGECLVVLAEILRAGADAGAFAVDDPDYTANHVYTQVLGTMHLARLGVGVRLVGGLPEAFDVDAERVRDSCVADVLAVAGVPVGARG